jgi:predicted nucleotidyltransferase
LGRKVVLQGLEYIKYLENNWRTIAQRVKEVAITLGKVDKVIVFGSVVKGGVTGSSDLDIAVIYDEKLSSKEKIRRTLEILDKVDEEVELDIHISKEEGYFLKLIEEYVEV